MSVRRISPSAQAAIKEGWCVVCRHYHPRSKQKQCQIYRTMIAGSGHAFDERTISQMIDERNRTCRQFEHI